MAFGINREQLNLWKNKVAAGEIAYLTHYWLDPRFPGVTSVTKVGCANLDKLTAWCRRNGLNPKYIHQREPFPHFDLIGPKQKEILARDGYMDHIRRFGL